MRHTSITMDARVHERLKRFCQENHIRMSAFITNAVETELDYIEHSDYAYEEIEVCSVADGMREWFEELKKHGND